MRKPTVATSGVNNTNARPTRLSAERDSYAASARADEADVLVGELRRALIPEARA